MILIANLTLICDKLCAIPLAVLQICLDNTKMWLTFGTDRQVGYMFKESTLKRDLFLSTVSVDSSPLLCM